MNNAAPLSQLPAECQALSIEPRHKVALDHFLLVDGTVWVVLLTRMPGDCPKAWHMTYKDFTGDFRVVTLCVAEVNDCPCYPVCHLVRVAWVHFFKHCPLSV